MNTTSPLADQREDRLVVSHERVWSGPIFAVDADHVGLQEGQELCSPYSE